MNRLDRLRAFNRFYAQRLGFLDRSYLDTGFTLTEMRVLYELAEGELRTARAMATALGLDEGYLSRLLKRFRAHGWVSRRADPSDARQGLLTLTPAGREVFRPLADRARGAVAQMIDPLTEAEQERLCTAVEEAQVLLGGPAPAPREIVLRDIATGDAGWIVARHGELYARDEGYDIRFEALVADIVAGFIRNRDPACDRAWIAVRGTERLGCIFCLRETPEEARLRLFLVDPSARGTGLGRRLLDACLDHARACGFRRMVLWTHASHSAACALYAKAGFTMIEEHPGEAFGQQVVDQIWGIDL